MGRRWHRVTAAFRMWSLIIAGFLAVCVIALFVMQGLRERRGALWLWLPVMIVPPVMAAAMLGVLPGHAGSGPDGGAVAMATGFYVLFVLPSLVALGVVWLCGCFLFPRGAGWSFTGGIGGTAIAAALLSVWWLDQHPPVEAIVVDAQGRPVAGQTVTFHNFDFGSSHVAGSALTGPDGRARARIPPGAESWVQTVGTDGVTCTASAERLKNNKPGEADRVAVTQTWSCRSWPEQSRIKLIIPYTQATPLRLRLRPAGTLFDPELVALYRTECTARMRHEPAGQFSLEEFRKNPELYLVLDDTLALYQAGVLETHLAELLLDQVIDALGSASRAFVEVAQFPTDRARNRVRLLRHWVDPDGHITDDRAAAEAIARRLQSVADRVVDVILPDWPGKSDHVFVKLDRFAHPHLPRLLAKLEQLRTFDTYRCADNLTRCEPHVEQVRPFFHSANREVALVAILSARRDPAFSPAEIKSLLEPYRNATGLTPELQQEINQTLSALPNRW